jgi:predicted transcriptional regulator
MYIGGDDLVKSYTKGSGTTALRTARELKGLTVRELSTIANIPETTLYGIEIRVKMV